MLKAKIHQATVTEANLYYIGSITIDSALLEACDLYPNEKVQVVNNNNGARIETYIIEGARNSGICCLNGAAARLFHPGDKIIIMSYCYLDKEEISLHHPKIIFLDENNQINSQQSHEEAATTYIDGQFHSKILNG